MIVRERAFGPCGGRRGPYDGRTFGPCGAECEARRDYKIILQKMAAIFGFSVIGERVFLEDPKKYTFGKTNFKTFFQNRIFEILPPFLSTLNS
tara:strand:- start:294 stop:572 length:279 start_codon:yes stop_codon:yes gene_type:complete